jgi:hypothetical protein
MEGMYTQERLAALTTFAEEARRSAGRRADIAVVLRQRAALARDRAEEAAARLRSRSTGRNGTTPPA